MRKFGLLAGLAFSLLVAASPAMAYGQWQIVHGGRHVFIASAWAGATSCSGRGRLGNVLSWRFPNVAAGQHESTRVVLRVRPGAYRLYLRGSCLSTLTMEPA